MGLRKTYTNPPRTAQCQTCDKQWSGANAVAVGAIHAETFQHVVVATATMITRFAPDTDEV